MRFIAIVGGNAQRFSCPEGLTLLTDTNGLAVYGDGNVQIKRFGKLIVVGELHDLRHDKTSYPNIASERAKGSEFEDLVWGRWGSYVALGFDRERDTLDILRSPSGLLPCYYIDAADGIVIGSDAQDILRSSGAPIAIDWEAVTLQLLRRDWRGPTCALHGLRDVTAGVQIHIGGGVCRRDALWSPARHIRRSRRPSFDEAVDRLRHTVDYCTEALVRSSGRMLLGVSGGLDSSIIAACLARSGADFVCFSMFAEGSDGDERSYARLLSDYLGVKLVESPYRLDTIDLEKSSVASLPRPIGWPFQQALDTACMAILVDEGAEAIVRGTGGDAVFCYNNSAAPIVDALIGEGPLAAGRTLLNLSALTGSSVWQCLAAAYRTTNNRGRPSRRVDGSLMAEFAHHHPMINAADPWLEECSDLPPGKQRHIDMLSASQNFVETRLALPRDVLCPLLSQPIIEVAIAIASPDWIRGAVNRAVARRAFAAYLPEQIVERTTKGGPMSFAADVYRTNRKRIREILLDGRLADQRIIDRPAVEIITANESGDVPHQFLRLLALVDAEAWISHWTAVAAG